MNKDKSLPTKKVYVLSHLKKTENDINDFYSEWEKFQEVIQTAS